MGLLREKEALRVEGDKNRQGVLALRWPEGTLVLDPPRLHRDHIGTLLPFRSSYEQVGRLGDHCYYGAVTLGTQIFFRTECS